MADPTGTQGIVNALVTGTVTSVLPTIVTTNITLVSNTTIAPTLSTNVPGGLVVAGQTSVGGLASPQFPVVIGGRAQSIENTSAGDARVQMFATDLYGKQIVLPFQNKELYFRVSTAFATAGPIVLAAANATLTTYITSLQIVNIGTTSGTVGLSDTATTIIPYSSGNATTQPTNNIVYSIPLSGRTSNTTITGVLSALSTFVVISVQGFWAS